MSGGAISDILSRAADRISKPGAWTQRVNARDEQGYPVDYYAPQARCWCMAGAVWAECHNDLDTFYEARSFLGPDTISGFNDAPGRTQAEVVAALRQAAARALEQGK